MGKISSPPVSLHGVFAAAALCFLAASGTSSAALVALYDFEGTTNDVSGNNKHPVAGSVSGFAPGFESLAGTFNGTNSHLRLPIDISPAGMPAVTMGAWVSSLNSSIRAAILSADDNDPGNYDRHIGIDNRDLNGNGVAGYSYSAFGGGGAGSHVLPSGATITPAFTFVAGRYDGSIFTLFVGGNSYTAVDTTDDDAVENPQLWIGKNPFYDTYFNGFIDNAFIFDEALTDTQIASIQAGGKAAILAVPEPTSAGLIAAGLALAGLRRRRLG